MRALIQCMWLRERDDAEAEGWKGFVSLAASQRCAIYLPPLCTLVLKLPRTWWQIWSYFTMRSCDVFAPKWCTTLCNSRSCSTCRIRLHDRSHDMLRPVVWSHTTPVADGRTPVLLQNFVNPPIPEHRQSLDSVGRWYDSRSLTWVFRCQPGLSWRETVWSLLHSLYGNPGKRQYTIMNESCLSPPSLSHVLSLSLSLSFSLSLSENICQVCLKELAWSLHHSLPGSPEKWKQNILSFVTFLYLSLSKHLSFIFSLSLSLFKCQSDLSWREIAWLLFNSLSGNPGKRNKII